MTERAIKLPDVGEGVAEAELVEWYVKLGDFVREDTLLAAVMTDKATIEIPSPAEGEVVWLGAKVGDVVAIGSDLVRLKVPEDNAGSPAQYSGDAATTTPHATEPTCPSPAPQMPANQLKPVTAPSNQPARSTNQADPAKPVSPRLSDRPHSEGEKPTASPAVRFRAREAGIDLRRVTGTGPMGRVTHQDLDMALARAPDAKRLPGHPAKTAVDDIKLIGLRRKIAEKVSTAHAQIPHITYVEEIDVTSLEDLRATLNLRRQEEQPRLTLLPFLMRAIVLAVAEQPQLNALFDEETWILHQHAGVHVGIAAQTSAGLMVPVVRHAETRDLWGCAAEADRLAAAAKAGTADRTELSGSTITISSLGALGGVVSTPIINFPEVAIIGVNKMMVRPLWDGSAFQPRKMMNLSSSFDHRVVDGWDAATFVQRIKTLLETPALIFMEG